VAIVILETAVTLRPDGGGTRAGFGITCRGICGSSLHDGQLVIRLTQYAHAFSV
jgi:hypothetical protein